MSQAGFPIGRRTALAGLAAGGLAMPWVRRATAQTAPLRIGMMSDLSSWGRDNGGAGAVYAAQQAAREFNNTVAGRPVEILIGDHQMSPDIGMTIARKWIDQDNVQAIADVPNSAIAFAVQSLLKEKDRVGLFSGPGSSELTNSRCNDRTASFTYNTYATAKVVTTALASQGVKSWFFIAADYAFGKQLQADATTFIQQAGGKVVGGALHPTGLTDFSSLLLQAQASGADVIALCNTGSDCTNALKQANEFGIVKSGRRMAALGMFLSDVKAAGLEVTQGTVYATSAYWAMSDATKAWCKPYFDKVGMMPTMLQIGTYTAVRHYLEAVAAANSIDAGIVMAKMRELPVTDAFVQGARLREDGMVIRDMYLAKVKSPAESKYPWDYLDIVQTVKGEDAYRPASQSSCPLLKKT